MGEAPHDDETAWIEEVDLQRKGASIEMKAGGESLEEEGLLQDGRCLQDDRDPERALRGVESEEREKVETKREMRRDGEAAPTVEARGVIGRTLFRRLLLPRLGVEEVQTRQQGSTGV